MLGCVGWLLKRRHWKVLCFGVLAEPSVQQFKGDGWAKQSVTESSKEPRRQDHTPSRKLGQTRISLFESVGLVGWLVFSVFLFLCRVVSSDTCGWFVYAVASFLLLENRDAVVPMRAQGCIRSAGSMMLEV